MASIAEILLEQGRQAAALRQRQGEISANLWGNLGNLAGSLPGQIQRAKAAEQDQQLRTLQIGNAQQQQTDLKSLDTAYSQQGGRDAILNALPGHLRPVVQQQFDAADESGAKALSSLTQADQHLQTYWGTLAQSVAAHGYSPVAAQTGLSHAKDLFKNYPQMLQQIGQVEAQIQADPTPEAIKAVVDPLIPPQIMKLGKDETATDIRRNVVVARGGEGLPTEASLANSAAGGNAQAAAAMKLLKPEKPEKPGSLEEQYLTALTSGDQTTANRILSTLKVTAAAKRDPDAAALARELGGLRADEAKARLAALQEKAQPLDISADVQTTVSGKKYIDLSSYQNAERPKARAAAEAAGAVALSKEQANALQEIDNARLNQRTILDGITSKLPKDPSGRITTGLGNKLSQYLQNDQYLSAVGSLRTAAIQTLRAAAGSKGLRINTAEIELAVENDIPKITDTVGTAQQKFKNLMAQLDNAETSIVTRDRSAVAPSTGSDTPAPAPNRTTTQPAFSVGDVVQVGSKRVKISAIHPDGTFDGAEVK